MKSADSEKTEVNSDPSMFVLNTIIEWSFLEELMQASMHVCNQFGPAKRVELIGYAEGFLSVIGRVYPDWTPKNDSLPDSFVVKIPSINNMQKMTDEAVFEELRHEITSQDEELEQMQQNLYKVNNSECAFYEWIESWQADIEVPRVYVHRKVTDTDKRGLLAMEYVDNASLTEIKSTLRPSEAMAVIDTIALVHAHSLKDTSWKDIPTVMWDDLMGENRSKHDIFQFIASIAKMDEERLQPLIKKFESIFEEVMDCDIGSKVLCSMNLQPVLCHGDLWINNLLWRKNGPTSRELAAIIDWQLVHGGCAAEDLARLFSSSLGPDDRRRHLDQLLQYYYTKLEDALGRAPPFSLHQVKESMFRLYPFLMTMALMSVGPLVTVKYKDLPRQEFEAIQRSLVDRAVALLEDIMYYHEKYGFLNK